MGEHNTGIIGFISWLGFYILGMFTAQSWSFLMGGIAALCTAVYYGAKAFEKIDDLLNKRHRKDDEG